LNNDNNIDYLKVVSSQASNTHTIVLQDVINAKETQDVAVIEVSKEPTGKVYVQIIGDVDLYGKDYIIEPSDIVNGTPNPGYRGGGNVVTYESNYHPVREWAIVTFLFSPVYVVYHSPFYWGYYPSYWHPWRPIYFENYWGYHTRFYGNNYYQRTVIIRNNYYSNYYVPRRSASTIVVDNYRGGRYNATYNGRTYSRPEEPRRVDASTRSEGNIPRNDNPRYDGNYNTPRPHNDGAPRQNNGVNPVRSTNDVSPRGNNQNVPSRQYNEDSSPRRGEQNAPRQYNDNNIPRGVRNTADVPRPSRSNPAPRVSAPSAPRSSGRHESSGERRER